MGVQVYSGHVAGRSEATRRRLLSKEVSVVTVPDSAENEAACLCRQCPSKVGDGLCFYCVRGRGPSVVAAGFCACNWCPLWSGYGLTSQHYCDRQEGEN
jgi:hypothetical protein